MYEVVPKLYLGSYKHALAHADKMSSKDMVVNCTKILSFDTCATTVRVAVDDDCSSEANDSMLSALYTLVPKILTALEKQNDACVYIFCKQGQQRSATVCAACLMTLKNLTAEQAIRTVQSKKPDAFFFQANFLLVLKQ